MVSSSGRTGTGRTVVVRLFRPDPFDLGAVRAGEFHSIAHLWRRPAQAERMPAGSSCHALPSALRRRDGAWLGQDLQKHKVGHGLQRQRPTNPATAAWLSHLTPCVYPSMGCRLEPIIWQAVTRWSTVGEAGGLFWSQTSVL
jgi:hypothetical protein